MEGVRPFDCLQGFLRTLEEEGQLARISAEVDPKFEVTEITTRVVREGGPCLLFERPRGAEVPLVINLFGHPRRIELALRRHPEAVGEELRVLAERFQKPGLRALWESRSSLRRVLAMNPRRCQQGSVTEVVEEPNLDRLPVLTCWPDDGGRFVTFGMVLTRDPQTRVRNLGLYRLQVHAHAQTGMHWQIQKGGGFHYWEAERLGQDLPATVILGGDPAVMLAAALPLPEGMDELAFAGFLQGRAVPLVGGKLAPSSASFEFPANAEFAIVGEVPAAVRRHEGPFGDHLGHYSAAADFPVFNARRWYHRNHPIYPAAVVGKPPQEDLIIGNAIQQILCPLITMLKPEIADLWAHGDTGFHGLTAVAVKQRYAREGIKSALGVLGEGQLSLTKCVLLVDQGVDVKSIEAVLEAVRANFDPAEDLLIIGGTAYDTLDFTSRRMNLGSKMIVDATTKGRERERLTGEARQRLASALEALGLPWRMLADALVAVEIRSGRPARDLARELALSLPQEIPLVVLVSSDVDITDTGNLLWGWFTRFEPAVDVIPRGAELVGTVVRYKGPVVIDATHKEGYQSPLVMAEDIVERVNRRWNEYRIYA